MINIPYIALTSKLLTNIGRYGCLVTNEVTIQGIDELDLKTLRKIISYFTHVERLTIKIKKGIDIEDGCTIHFDKKVNLKKISLRLQSTRSRSTIIISKDHSSINSPMETVFIVEYLAKRDYQDHNFQSSMTKKSQGFIQDSTGNMCDK